MLILSIDSCGSGCAACLWRDGDVLALKQESMERGQDQRLVPLVLETMAAAGIEFSALDRIAVTRGPGSFTGLRIGLAAARGFGLAAGKPVVGVDRFRVYAAQIKNSPSLERGVGWRGDPLAVRAGDESQTMHQAARPLPELLPRGEAGNSALLVVLGSKRAELFCKLCAEDGQDVPDMLAPGDIAAVVASMPGIVVAGDAAELLRAHMPDGLFAPLAEPEVVTAALLAADAKIGDTAFLPRPLYLRAPDVTFPKTKATA